MVSNLRKNTYILRNGTGSNLLLKKIQAIALVFYGEFSLLQKLEVLMFLEYTSVACRLLQVGGRTGG